MTISPPELTEDRIGSMRSTVMHAVDNDVARRGTRARRTIGLAAASLLVVGGGTIGVNQLGGGGSSRGSASSADSTTAGGTRQLGKPTTDKAAPDKNTPNNGIDDRQVITTGTVNVTVKHPRDAAQQLSVFVDSIGGRVDARTENGNGKDASAFLEVRVPSTKVTATVAKLGTFGTVTDVSLQNQDVTTASKDLDARIRALRISVARLEKLLSQATSSSALVEAESALTQRQQELESLQTQRASIADQVQLSTLSINLSQKTRAESVSSGGFRGGLIDGWNALVSTVNNIVEVVGLLLPWAALVAVLYGAYLLVTRRRRHS